MPRGSMPARLACAGVLTDFGQSGTLPPWLAGWIAAVFFPAFACLRLTQVDDSEA